MPYNIFLSPVDTVNFEAPSGDNENVKLFLDNTNATKSNVFIYEGVLMVNDEESGHPIHICVIFNKIVNGTAHELKMTAVCSSQNFTSITVNKVEALPGVTFTITFDGTSSGREHTVKADSYAMPNTLPEFIEIELRKAGSTRNYGNKPKHKISYASIKQVPSS